MQGVPLFTIQAWMGHEDIATTQKYLHWQPQGDDAARLSAAFSQGTADEIVKATI
jgi:site-specific recombinase XerD